MCIEIAKEITQHAQTASRATGALDDCLRGTAGESRVEEVKFIKDNQLVSLDSHML